jgi:nucleotide-binding universal stress UspA family protein
MSAEARGIKRIKTIFREGKPARTIVAYAKSARIDAIIMGSRGLSEFESALLGSVSHKVASLADCEIGRGRPGACSSTGPGAACGAGSLR